VKRLSDTLTYRGIASEAVFTDPPGADWFKLFTYNYSHCRLDMPHLVGVQSINQEIFKVTAWRPK